MGLLAAAYKSGFFRISLNSDDTPYFLSHEVLNPKLETPAIKAASPKSAFRIRQGGWVFSSEEESAEVNFQYRESPELHAEFINEKKNPGISFTLEKGDELFGLGAGNGKPLRNDMRLMLLNQDTLFYSFKEKTYASFPILLIKRGADFFLIFFPSSFPLFYQADQKQATFLAVTENEQVALDLFVYYAKGTLGLRKIYEQYALLTASPLLPPVWALGYHQSRYSFRSQREVLEVAERIRSEQIPADALYLDIHYMQGYRVFTWDVQKFPEPGKMNKDLSRMGLRTVAIVDPGIKSDNHYHVYREGIDNDVFCRNTGGEIYTGKVWPGKTVFPDFSREDVREWWSRLHEVLLRNGVSGVWNDMNDPVLRINEHYNPLKENIRHEFGSHAEYRNLYATHMAEATRDALIKNAKNTRPFLLTRSGFSGIQNLSFLWTGDNRTTWKDLKKNLHMVIHLGLSGHPFTGADIGGFGGASTTFPMTKFFRNPELFTRWIELGSLLPFFRIHTAVHSYSQFPWSFGKKVLAHAKKNIKRRYQFLPYLYTLSVQAHLTGMPVIRPLFMHYPSLSHEESSDMFLVGQNVLAAPVLKKGKSKKSVRLPEGKWIHFDSRKAYSGEKAAEVKAPPGTMPLFVRAGSVLPLATPGRNAEETLQSSLVLEVFPDKTLFGEVYLDDGISLNAPAKKSLDIEIRGKTDKSGRILLTFHHKQKRFKPEFSTMTIRLPAEYIHARNGRIKFEREKTPLGDEGRSAMVSVFYIPFSTKQIIFEKQSK